MNIQESFLQAVDAASSVLGRETVDQIIEDTAAAVKKAVGVRVVGTYEYGGYLSVPDKSARGGSVYGGEWPTKLIPRFTAPKYWQPSEQELSDEIALKTRTALQSAVKAHEPSAPL
jgi:hypothetical protein